MFVSICVVALALRNVAPSSKTLAMSRRLPAFALPSKPVCWGLAFLFPSKSFSMPAGRISHLASRAPKLLLFIFKRLIVLKTCMVRSYPSCVPGRYISCEQDKAKDVDCSVLSAEIPIRDLALLSDGHEKELIKRRTGQVLPMVGFLRVKFRLYTKSWF
ncbi:hypothetical protein RJ639_041410 [Escallonia herrerae]|uniref:Uncharacterized protein n=1 Tax=Escallonia herrerae TaxID=1293975 RepID=A0AA88WLE5_9ASTE|nr:hypothetical protein RJ639_041410 [Escallonia herrerae]